MNIRPEYKGLDYEMARRKADELIARHGWHQCLDQLIELKHVMDRTRSGLPKYKSHKTVRAVKIAAIEYNADGQATITPADLNLGKFETKPGWIGRFKGHINGDLGYYVLYEDGYESWSPTRAFEEGYTRV